MSHTATGDETALVAWVLLFIATFSVALRSVVRIFITKQFRVDDWLMLVGYALFVVLCVSMILCVQAGFGQHNKSLPQDEEIHALMWLAVATAVYVIDGMFIKLSIGFFLLRVASGKVYRWIIKGSLIVILIWSLASFLWDVFQCTPVRTQWDYTVPGGKCVPVDQVVYAAYALSVLTITTDWLYALLPIPMIWGVQMTVQAKMTVIAVLGLGIFASVATIVRLKFLAGIGVSDVLFEGTDAMMWTIIELGVGITAASLATVRPLLRSLKIRGFGSSERSHHNTGANHPRSQLLSGSKYARGRSTHGPLDIPGVDYPDPLDNDQVALVDLENGQRTDRAGRPGITVTQTVMHSESSAYMGMLHGAGGEPAPHSFPRPESKTTVATTHKEGWLDSKSSLDSQRTNGGVKSTIQASEYSSPDLSRPH